MRLCLGRRQALSRESLLFHESARPREGAWVGPEGGPLHCGARCRNRHMPLRWGAESEVCGGWAGPVVPTNQSQEPVTCPPHSRVSPGTLRKGRGGGREGERRGQGAPRERVGPAGLHSVVWFRDDWGVSRRKGSRWEPVGRVRWRRDCQPPTPQGKSLEGVRTQGWVPTAVCAQKQGWGQRGEEGRQRLGGWETG